jgi:hypothetical protein
LAVIGNASHDTLLRFEMGHIGESIKVHNWELSYRFLKES